MASKLNGSMKFIGVAVALGLSALAGAQVYGYRGHQIESFEKTQGDVQTLKENYGRIDERLKSIEKDMKILIRRGR